MNTSFLIHNKPLHTNFLYLKSWVFSLLSVQVHSRADFRQTEISKETALVLYMKKPFLPTESTMPTSVTRLAPQQTNAPDVRTGMFQICPCDCQSYMPLEVAKIPPGCDFNGSFPHEKEQLGTGKSRHFEQRTEVMQCDVIIILSVVLH